MTRILYRTFGGETYDLSGRHGMSINAGELHDWEWKPTKEASYNLIQTAREAKAVLSCSHGAKRTLDRFLDACDADCAAGTPGTLVYGEWSLTCFIVSGKRIFTSAVGVQYSIQFRSENPIWWREYLWEYVPQKRNPSGVDYPYEYRFDYGQPSVSKDITVVGRRKSPVRIVIYGACSNPKVEIEGNRYEVRCDVPPGGYLVIDGMPGQLGVWLVDAGGNQTDVFPLAERGTGRNSGEYIFQKVSPGLHSVSWDNSFSFDCTVREERARLPWQ